MESKWAHPSNVRKLAIRETQNRIMAAAQRRATQAWKRKKEAKRVARGHVMVRDFSLEQTPECRRLLIIYY